MGYKARNKHSYLARLDLSCSGVARTGNQRDLYSYCHDLSASAEKFAKESKVDLFPLLALLKIGASRKEQFMRSQENAFEFHEQFAEYSNAHQNLEDRLLDGEFLVAYAEVRLLAFTCKGQGPFYLHVPSSSMLTKLTGASLRDLGGHYALDRNTWDILSRLHGAQTMDVEELASSLIPFEYVPTHEVPMQMMPRHEVPIMIALKSNPRFALEVAGGHKARHNGKKIQLWDRVPGVVMNRIWFLSLDGRIRLNADQRWCLDVEDGINHKSTNGRKIQLFKLLDERDAYYHDQLFVFEGGHIRWAFNRKMCLHTGREFENGTQILLWEVLQPMDPYKGHQVWDIVHAFA